MARFHRETKKEEAMFVTDRRTDGQTDRLGAEIQNQQAVNGIRLRLTNTVHLLEVAL